MLKKIKLLFCALKKFTKYIGFGLAALLLLIVIIVGSVNTKHTKQLKQYKKTNTELLKTIDSLNTKCDQLSSLDAIRVDVSMNVKSTNVLGVTNLKADQIAHTIAAYTRQEVLDSLIKNQ